jgi:LuxR family maltose regulon positive regulatory protein
MSRIRYALGDLDGALELLDEAERRYVSDFFPNVRPISARRTRVGLAQGAVDKAIGWVREAGLSTDDELSYLHEFEHITLARVLMAESSRVHLAAHPAAHLAGFLEGLRQAAQAGERTGTVIEVLVLQALLHLLRGDADVALAAVQDAVTLAEPEGYVRTFTDEGAPMASLLRVAAKRGIRTDYVNRLLAAMDVGVHQRSEPDVPVRQQLIDPLSARELQVLRLLGTELDGPDIARKLFVSLNTVRTHTKNIYAKLGVNNRRESVRRGRDLGLLP